jgi:outer membrane lipoprotein-sorting protein
MKKIILFIFLLGINLFASNTENFQKIDTLKAIVEETSRINNKEKTKKYEILLMLPDKMVKTMIFPETNQGEVYLYNGEKKTIYYPLLEQVIDEKITEDENYTLKFIRDLKKGNANSKDVKFITNNGQIGEILYKDGMKIKFLEFSNIDGINFPTDIVIFDRDMEISHLKLKDIKINIPVSEKDFSADEIIKN